MNRYIRKSLFTTLALCASLAAAENQPPKAAGAEAQRFASPQAGAEALLKAAESGDAAQMSALFGAGNADLLSSGDEVEDKNNREAFIAMAKEKLAADKAGEDRAIIHAGNSDWPFPIPLVKRGDDWQFDAGQGREEIINRRVGRNELSALGVINAYLEAQFEYANTDHNGDGVSEYAQKLASDPGQQNGLFWESQPGQPESPLGPLVAQARAEGYKLKGGQEKPVPYHGYYYRILTRQGNSAPGGAYDYIINGNMIAGFGLLAFPANYGASGVMSFIVNHQGRIYQKDLGPKTEEAAKAIKEYNPDPSWQPVQAVSSANQ